MESGGKERGDSRNPERVQQIEKPTFKLKIYLFTDVEPFQGSRGKEFT
jgi:hypothetical protein